MKNNKVRMGLIFISVLISLSILGFVFWNTLRDTIVIPVYYLIWITGLILKNIPQNVYLTLLCLVLLGIGIHTLRALDEKKSSPLQTDIIHRETSRYIYWMRLLASSPKNEYYWSKFELEARSLILSIFAYQEGLDPAAVEQKITQNEMIVPEAVKRLIEKRDWWTGTIEASWFERLKHKIWFLYYKTEAEDDRKTAEGIKEIVHFIEDRLEIAHDGNDSEYYGRSA